MRIVVACCLSGALFIASGCVPEGGITPSETVVDNNSARDFGFVGEWVPVPDRDHPQKTQMRLKIERGESYQVTLKLTAGTNEDELRASFCALEIFQDHPHAFVEIERKELPFPFHSLAIAAVKDDHLYLWSIDGHKLAELLYADGKPAVVEHFSLSSKVRCKPELLLETLRNHAKEVMEEPQVYRRVK